METIIIEENSTYWAQFKAWMGVKYEAQVRAGLTLDFDSFMKMNALAMGYEFEHYQKETERLTELLAKHFLEAISLGFEGSFEEFCGLALSNSHPVKRSSQPNRAARRAMKKK